MCLNQAKIRDSIESDIPFICDAYWRSQKKTDNKEMCEIKNIVKNNKVRVICLKDDENVILSFVVFDDNKKIIYGYTKSAFRKMGLFKYLCGHI